MSGKHTPGPWDAWSTVATKVAKSALGDSYDVAMSDVSARWRQD
jgi:hypothetical protein